jgi:hypothetical protein
MRPPFIVPAIGLALSGCSKTPLPSGPHVEPSAQSALSSSTVMAGEAPSPIDSAPPNLPDGCWTGMNADAAAENLLTALAERCAPGTRPIEPGPKRVELGAAEASELMVSVDDSRRCLRALAAGGPGVLELELELVDSRDRLLGHDELEAPFALVGARGPVCADGPGEHRARVRVRRGRGSVAFGIFRPEAPASGP